MTIHFSTAAKNGAGALRTGMAIAGLQHLANLTKLKKLDLTECHQITPAGRASLAAHLPNLTN